MNALYAWVDLHPGIVIAAAIVALGFRVNGLVRRQRARSRRGTGAESMIAQQIHGTMPMPSALRRLWNGASYGAVFPGVFSVLIWAIYLFGVRFLRDDSGTTIDLLVLSIAYPVGSVSAGAILGLGMPLLRDFVRSSLVGMAAIAPLMIGISLSMDNALTQWTTESTVVTAFLTVMFGMMLGYCATIVTRRRRDGSARTNEGVGGESA